MVFIKFRITKIYIITHKKYIHFYKGCAKNNNLIRFYLIVSFLIVKFTYF